MPPTKARSDDSVVDAWRGLLETHARAHGALERALFRSRAIFQVEPDAADRRRAGADRHVEDFTELGQIVDTHKAERRMQELGDAVHLSQSAISRVVARLEQDGLATRGMCAEDRRGIYVCITDAGRKRYRAARPAHRAALADTLGG